MIWLIFVPQLAAGVVTVAGVAALLGSAIIIACPGAQMLYAVAFTVASVVLIVVGRYNADPGWQFLKRLKADLATAAVPVLVCTANVALLERVADRVSAWACGKPHKRFDVEELLVCVRPASVRHPVLGTSSRPEPIAPERRQRLDAAFLSVVPHRHRAAAA